MEINLELLYVVIGIIYFIYNVVKNLRRKPVTREEGSGEEEVTEETPQRPHRRETVSKPFDERVGRPVSRPTSFEELFQEFDDTAAESRHKDKAEEKIKKVREVDDEFQPMYDTPDVNYTEKEAEKRIRETEARKALQEKASAVERAEAIDKELSRKLREDSSKSVSPAAPEERKKSGVYQHENKRRQQILQMLKNPDNITNTIITSEILRRKYF